MDMYFISRWVPILILSFVTHGYLMGKKTQLKQAEDHIICIGDKPENVILARTFDKYILTIDPIFKNYRFISMSNISCIKSKGRRLG
jgi:hypothetical protein